MKEIVINYVRHGSYLDSVALMQFSKKLLKLPGVNEAAIMMGTPGNLQIMADAKLLDESIKDLEGGDMIIAVRADTRANAEDAIETAKNLLEKPKDRLDSNFSWKPKTLRSALAETPGTNLVLISVPGEFAAAEARKAIRRGLHVMIFSDNVSVEDERALKMEAKAQNCLMMGPDCGTAILNGVPLAFANKVPRGNIGIIGASGTGIQEVSTLIAKHGGGVSHAIGVGGRDLRSEIGGITTLMALEILERDPATIHIVLISKPPSPDIVKKVLRKVAVSKKQVTVCFIGMQSCQLPGNANFAATLKAAAESALNKKFLKDDTMAERGFKENIDTPSFVRGLYSGGTLCAEAQVIFKTAGETLVSNAPIPGVKTMNECNETHSFVDLGADEYTQGKPHPMIDPSVRNAQLRDALSDERVGVILFDIVIGFGSHHDPAGHIKEFLANYTGVKTILIASVTGTETDPQELKLQIAKLKDAGVLVASSNADAASLALVFLKKLS